MKYKLKAKRIISVDFILEGENYDNYHDTDAELVLSDFLENWKNNPLPLEVISEISILDDQIVHSKD